MRTISPQPSSNAAVLSEQTKAHGAGQSAKGRSPAAPGSAGAAKDKDRGAAESRALQGGMVTAQNLYVTFNRGTPIENPVLRGLSLSIDKGEFVTVIGSNGAGKSTFLNALTGEQRVDFGKIVIDGQDVTRMPTHKRSPFIARVFQDPMAGTCESLSIEQNLALAFRRDRKVGFKLSLNKEIRDVFRSKLAALNLGLENRLTDSMGLLSGGQRQAVSLLMASLRPSKILLLDEHTAALDPKTASFVLKLTNEIVTSGNLTAMMVTHSMKDALEYGSRTVMLHRGRVILDVKGERRKKMTVIDLLEMFEKTRGKKLDDDSLLLG